MKLYTRDQVSQVMRFFEKWAEENGLSTCDLIYPELTPIDVELVGYVNQEDKIMEALKKLGNHEIQIPKDAFKE